MLGARRWLELESWPPPGAETVSMPIPGTSFDHDPANLPPSLGGRILKVNTAGGPGWGQFDQRPVAAHPGVSTVELGASPARRLAGPVRARLATAATGADNADWVCTLCVRDGDGALLNLCEGIARGAADASEVAVDLGNICVELPPGADLCLLVAGATYPRWEPLAGSRRQTVGQGSTLELTAAGDV
jgi:predicted acyl esterase